MNTGFEDNIRAAIQTGRALALDFDRLIKIARDPKAETPEVEVTLMLELSSVYQRAGIVQGADLLGLLPPGLLPPPPRNRTRPM